VESRKQSDAERKVAKREENAVSTGTRRRGGGRGKECESG